MASFHQRKSMTTRTTNQELVADNFQKINISPAAAPMRVVATHKVWRTTVLLNLPSTFATGGILPPAGLQMGKWHGLELRGGQWPAREAIESPGEVCTFILILL